MTFPDLAILFSLVIGAVFLVGTNVALQRVASPDRGSERIAGCCGMALPYAITNPRDDDQ
jgi:hypothetical protein